MSGFQATTIFHIFQSEALSSRLNLPLSDLLSSAELSNRLKSSKLDIRSETAEELRLIEKVLGNGNVITSLPYTL